MSTLEYPTMPKWIEVPRAGEAPKGLEPSLTDVISHLADQRTYKDDRHITWAHETTHGINAFLRNQRVAMTWSPYTAPRREDDKPYWLPQPAGYLNEAMTAGNLNGFYVLGGQGIRFLEPAPLKLSDVAAKVPQALQGMSYKTYLVDQQRYWQDTPLYLCDEWSAYLNGLTVGVEGRGIQGSYSDVLQPLEFMGYAWTLFAMVCQQEYNQTMELRNFFAYQTARTLQLMRAATWGQEQAAAYLKAFEADATSYVVKVACGQSWYERVFHDKLFDGIF